MRSCDVSAKESKKFAAQRKGAGRHTDRAGSRFRRDAEMVYSYGRHLERKHRLIRVYILRFRATLICFQYIMCPSRLLNL